MAGDNPTRPDLLDRVRATGIPIADFERRFELPARFLNALREGKYNGSSRRNGDNEKAAYLIAKLEAALIVCETSPRDPRVAPVPGGYRTGNAALAPEIEEEITSAMAGADTLEKWEALQRKLMVYRMKGQIQETLMRTFNDGLATFRQSQKEKRQAQTDDPTEPVRVVIEYVNVKAVSP